MSSPLKTQFNTLKGLTLITIHLCALPSRAEDVPVNAASPYGYNSSSVQQIIINGEKGRYITFTGRTTGVFGGKILPPIGDIHQREFTYHLDCKDGTFDRLGDKRAPIMFKPIGWKPLTDDPSAKVVFTKYCPKINSLSMAKPPDSEGNMPQRKGH